MNENNVNSVAAELTSDAVSVTETILSMLPPMETGAQLIDDLAIYPPYDQSIRMKSGPERLIALSDLYSVYVPGIISVEIYDKIYLALTRSLQKKLTKNAIRQSYANRRLIQGQTTAGIMGGSDSFTIIGTSGIGKSTAIDRAISLITGNRILMVEKPFLKIIPCLIVQCPFDSSVKGLLYEILRKTDLMLGTKYYDNAVRSRSTTDMLIGSVSQVCLNHIGLLVVDEIQNVVNAKNGRNLIGCLTQLINNSGISIAMIGTPECEDFFGSAMQLARRSLGLSYGPLAYDDYFENLCRIIYSFQYVRNETEAEPAVIHWLFEHSAGIVSNVVSLIHDAQEIAITSRGETLDLETLTKAYDRRMKLLHDYIRPAEGRATTGHKAAKKVPAVIGQNESKEDGISLVDLVNKVRAEELEPVEYLSRYITIEEVAV